MAGKLIIVHAPIDVANLPSGRLTEIAVKRVAVFGALNARRCFLLSARGRSQFA
jgi:hypothetical protein